jgi:2-polyprenyl-6-methoxyphenol hydroxylase-like FAD-dependent oxidoreductase
MAALTIRQEGYPNVIVFEKRTSFSRNNVVNLHPESLHVFQRLGILDRFLARASMLVDHGGHVFLDDIELFSFDDAGYHVEIDPDHSFDVEDVLNGFRNETLYSITLADLQDLLATVACERGVSIVSDARVELVPDRDGVHSLRAEIGEARLLLAVERPQLILIAEGVKSGSVAALGGKYLAKQSLWPNENWVFGNYRCRPSRGFSHLLFEFRAGCDDLTISNCIFMPLQRQVNVAVTVSDPDIPASSIEAIILAQAKKILHVADEDRSDGGLVWHSGRAVRIAPRSVDRCHFGKNVVVIGDALGANSPVAALGCTLATSAYAYAIRCLVRDLETDGAETALGRYAARAEACVERWHDKVNEIRRTIDQNIRHRAMHLVGAEPAQRTASSEAL